MNDARLLAGGDIDMNDTRLSSRRRHRRERRLINGAWNGKEGVTKTWLLISS